MVRRLSRLTSKQAADLDGKVFSALYEQWMRWEVAGTARRRHLPPPCPTSIQFLRFLPRGRGSGEISASLERLKGRGLVRSIPNKWGGGEPIAPGEGHPNYCLVPVRTGPTHLQGRGRRKPPRN